MPKEASSRAKGKAAQPRGAKAGSRAKATRDVDAEQDQRDDGGEMEAEEEGDDGDNGEGPATKIPDGLLSRILHEFFTREDTRMSKAANKAVGRYFEVFVQEAIARTASEKEGRFLEVEDLEKITPQLLMDL